MSSFLLHSIYKKVPYPYAQRVRYTMVLFAAAETFAGSLIGTFRIGRSTDGNFDLPSTADPIRIERTADSLTGNIGFRFRETARRAVAHIVIFGGKRAAKCLSDLHCLAAINKNRIPAAKMILVIGAGRNIASKFGHVIFSFYVSS